MTDAAARLLWLRPIVTPEESMTFSGEVEGMSERPVYSCGAPHPQIVYALEGQIETLTARAEAAEAEIERLRAIPAKLRQRHFAGAHTDVVGDEERREGYLLALADCERAATEGKE